MSINRRSWFWLWLSIALFLGVMSREVWQFAAYDNREPVTFEKVETLNSPISAGDSVIIRVWREKVRDDCPVLSSPYLISENGVVTKLTNSYSIGGAAGTPYFDAGYHIPTGTPPGQYELTDTLSYRCPNKTFNIPQPVARFRIIDVPPQ